MVDREYYGNSCPCCSNAVTNVGESIRFDADLLENVLKEIYNEEVDPSEGEFPQDLFEATRDLFEQASAKGMSQSQNKGIDKDVEFLKQYDHSIEVFSAFRTHRYAEFLADALYDKNGKLKSFEDWRYETRAIQDHFNRSWLETEYNTAVLRSEQAADWRRFEDMKEDFPCLKWMPTSSATPREEHAVFWKEGLTLPVDDPFWKEHYPGDQWNCKCYLEQTQGKPTKKSEMPEKKDMPQPAKGLDTNPGKKKEMFSRDHSYYEQPKTCIYLKLANNGVKSIVGKIVDTFKCPGNCNGCYLMLHNMPKKKDGLKTPPSVEEYTPSKDNKHILVGPNQGAEFKVNLPMAEILQKKFKDDVYMLPNIDPANKEMRTKYVPEGVPENKNVDFLVSGRLIEGKNALTMEHPNVEKSVKNVIRNRIKEAKEQSREVIIEIPKGPKRRWINDAVYGYLKQTKSIDFVYIKQGKKLFVYEKRRT